MASSSTSAPTHVTESMSDRRKQRELAEARQSGTVAPEVDVKTGAMINPHNPEFITRRPWYLGSNDAGPSLDHQADLRTEAEKTGLSLAASDALLRASRDKQKRVAKEGAFQPGMWVEALKKNKKPYLMAQIIRIATNGSEFDLKYEDGSTETRIRLKRGAKVPRMRMTKSGARSFAIDHDVHGKETYDSKRDAYHGYDAGSASHAKRIEERFKVRDALRKERREKEKYVQHGDGSSGVGDGGGAEGGDGATNGSGGGSGSGGGGGRQGAGGGGGGDAAQQQRGRDPHQQRKSTAHSDSDSDSDYDSDHGDGSDSEEEFVQRDEDAKTFTSRLARQGGVGGAQMKVTARNLRIREDTAKYLRNLDPNSAYYDPKSRSMRDNPHPELDPDESPFIGDNAARISGDAVGLAETQLFAWDASAKGVAGGGGGGGGDGGAPAADGGGGEGGADGSAAGGGTGGIHPQANPSQAELLKKKFKSRKTDLKQARKKAVLDRYGGSEYLDGGDGLAAGGGEGTASSGAAATSSNGAGGGETAEERKARFGVSVSQEVYSRDGRLVQSGTGEKVNKRIALTSKYEEDIHINGHNTVWGSYFHKGAFAWGYADDHSLLKQSYGTGPTGRIANDQANDMRYGDGSASGTAALSQAREMLRATKERQGGGGDGTVAQAAPPPPPSERSKLYGEANPNANLDAAKVKEALRKQDERSSKPLDVRKRKYNSLDAGDENDVTEEDMEAYRLRKGRSDDPMAKLAGGDELLEYK